MPDQCDQGMLRDRQTLLPSSDVSPSYVPAPAQLTGPSVLRQGAGPRSPSSLLGVPAERHSVLSWLSPGSHLRHPHTRDHTEARDAESRRGSEESSRLTLKFCSDQETLKVSRTVQQKCCLWQIGCSRLWLNRPHFKVGCNDSLAFLSSESVCVLWAQSADCQASNKIAPLAATATHQREKPEICSSRQFLSPGL